MKSLDIPKTGPITVRAEGKNGQWSAACDTVIGADGANGIIAKCVGLRKVRALAIAIEAEVPHEWGSGHEDLRPEICHLEYGAIPQGYAWVFPKGDHLNVGAGVFRPRSGGRDRGDAEVSVKVELRKAILDYLRMLGVPKAENELKFNAHPLPIWNGLDRIQTRDNRVLLAGDSAGLINPFFGDGILHALKSGQIAARCILEHKEKEYTREISGEFRSNMNSALKLAKVFYRWPHICYSYGVKRPGIRARLQGLSAARQSLPISRAKPLPGCDERWWLRVSPRIRLPLPHPKLKTHPESGGPHWRKQRYSSAPAI